MFPCAGDAECEGADFCFHCALDEQKQKEEQSASMKDSLKAVESMAHARYAQQPELWGNVSWRAVEYFDNVSRHASTESRHAPNVSRHASGVAQYARRSNVS
jgi:hypothetical protein